MKWIVKMTVVQGEAELVVPELDVVAEAEVVEVAVVIHLATLRDQIEDKTEVVTASAEELEAVIDDRDFTMTRILS